MAVSNVDLLNQIRENQSQEYKDRVPVATAKNLSEIYALLQAYPTQYNEFITTLSNRIMKTMFFSRVWKNPLKPLHKGMMPIGYTIQQIFVDMAERKGLKDNYGDNAEQSLLGTTIPTVHEKFISKNFMYKYKVTISEERLASAFNSEYGLESLCNQLLVARQRKAYQDEYTDMKGILTRQKEVSENGAFFSKGVIQRICEDSDLKTSAVVKLKKGFSANELAEELQTKIEEMGFQTKNYNLAKVETFTDPSELMIFTTPRYKAKLNVETLAYAFNIDKADVPNKRVTIDSFPQYQIDGVNYNIIAVIGDNELIQQWDTLNTTKQFENGDNLTRNVWLHRHGISATCDFAQCALIVEPVE